MVFSSQALPQPIPQLRFSELRQVVHTLLTQIDALQLSYVLRRCSAHSCRNNQWIGLEDDPIVDNLVNRKRNQVVVFDNCALVDGCPTRVSYIRP
jgi:hypothetical protein